MKLHYVTHKIMCIAVGSQDLKIIINMHSVGFYTGQLIKNSVMHVYSS